MRSDALPRAGQDVFGPVTCGLRCCTRATFHRLLPAGTHFREDPSRTRFDLGSSSPDILRQLTPPQVHTQRREDAMPTTPPPQGPPPGWFDPQAPYGRPPEGPFAPPPQFGFQQPYPQYQQPPPPPVYGPQANGWWHDGHKWRPPVGAQPSRAQLAGQLPGAIIKLIALGFLLWILLAAFGIVH